jgi:hypothetical protein
MFAANPRSRTTSPITPITTRFDVTLSLLPQFGCGTEPLVTFVSVPAEETWHCAHVRTVSCCPELDAGRGRYVIKTSSGRLALDFHPGERFTTPEPHPNGQSVESGLARGCSVRSSVVPSKTPARAGAALRSRLSEQRRRGSGHSLGPPSATLNYSMRADLPRVRV